MPGLLIIGAGGHGKVVADVALLTEQWDKIAFLDDREDVKEVTGIPVIGKTKNFAFYKLDYPYAFVAIGDNKIRSGWIDKLQENGFILPTLIHPMSYISRSCLIGEGSIVKAGAYVDSSVSIGKGCIINSTSTVGHDCKIGNSVHISPGANIGGTVNIGDYTWICIGSNVVNNITIGNHVVVAGGSTVIRDVPDSVMVAGIPADIKKKLIFRSFAKST